MSLLMDALKRAEATKQEAKPMTSQPEEEKRDPQEKLSLQPIVDGQLRQNSNPLPDLAAHLEAVDADLAEAANPSPLFLSSQKASTPEEERHAIRNSFAVKQVDASSSKRNIWIGLGIVLALTVAIGGYFWLQLESINNAASLAKAIRTPPPPPQEPAVATITEKQAMQPPAGDAPPPDSRTLPLFPPEPLARRDPISATTIEPVEPVRLTRSAPETDPGLILGQAHLLRNEIELARKSFEQALNRDPNNTDALLSLAAIAQHQHRPSDAGRLYQQAWVANPGDPAVQAALLSNGTTSDNDAQGTESRLKMLLDKQPQSAALNFALGNLLARQNRWPEAQEAYFNAVAADADNPDYLFNLAVSLDHIRQPIAAAQHYRLALEMATRRPAGFNFEQARRRLADLSPDRK